VILAAAEDHQAADDDHTPPPYASRVISSSESLTLSVSAFTATSLSFLCTHHQIMINPSSLKS
jgi:hypothetical protein